MPRPLRCLVFSLSVVQLRVVLMHSPVCVHWKIGCWVLLLAAVITHHRMVVVVIKAGHDNFGCHAHGFKYCTAFVQRHAVGFLRHGRLA